MSYSRWGSSSIWYTYWCSGAIGDDDKRDEQLFDICSVMMFTYRELKDDISGCIDKVKDSEDAPITNSENDYKELQGYMESFMADVEEQYNTPSQLYKDGEISLEEAFIEEV